MQAKLSKMPLRRQTVAVLLIWTIIVAGFLTLTLFRERQHTRELAIKAAHAHFDKDQAFRLWATKHGGVYVTPNDRTPPNPYLSHIPDRDITTTEGKQLTLMNPAYIIRQMMEEYANLYGIQGRITSLNVLNPQNKPDEWEIKALQSFDAGAKEMLQFTNIKGKPYLRLMSPMITKKGCLKCHGFQGFKEGDIRGGVGVSVPMEEFISLESGVVSSMTISHCIIWIFGLTVIGLISHRSNKRMIGRIKAETALKESELWLSNIFETMEEALLVVNPDRHVRKINSSAERMFGYSSEDLLGQSTEILHVDHEHYVKFGQKIEDAFKRNRPAFFEYRVRRKNGEIFPTEHTVSLLNDDSGNTLGIVSVVRDITKRKQLEDVLKQKAAFVQNNPAPVMQVNMNHEIISCNPALKGVVAFHPIGKQIGELFQSFKDVNLNEITDESNIQYNENINGHSFLFTIRKDSATNSYFIYGSDISKLKQIEIELQEKTIYLESILTSAQEVAIAAVDLNFKIIYYNPIAEKLFGYKTEEVIGKTVMEMHTKETVDPYRFEDAIAKVKSAGKYDYIVEDVRNGETIIISSTITGIWDNQKLLIGYLLMSHDITKRKQHEAEREQLLYQLAAKNKEMEQLIYITSHDLRSPLVNVQGFCKELEYSFSDLMSIIQSKDVSQEVQSKLDPILNNDIPECMAFINSSVLKMHSLISGILKLSRTGKVELNIKDLNMNEILDDVCMNFNHTLRNSGIELDVASLPSCKGDEEQINILISNLVDNAIKYMDPGRPGVIKISGQSIEKKSVYCVEDNGIGIDPAYEKLIFDIFHRLQPDIVKGEGLGLTIAKRIVEMMSGDIWLESKPGKGSKFFISLPA